MTATILLISLCAFGATLLGGFVAIHLKDKLHLILGLSAGAVIGVAFADLMPEALGLGSLYHSIPTMLAFVAAGFLFFMVLDRSVILHSHNHTHDHEHEATSRGKLGALSLSIHSFLDGAAIGLAFQVSPKVGLIVATAVLVHDFSDGINTVNLIFKNRGEGNEARKWLLVDALAPVVGAISTLFFALPESVLSVVLAIFAGFFLYIGASDLLPESFHGHPTRWTTAATIIGAAIIFVAVRLAGI
ncbi:MAG TPA: ZIP family metal transporter [Candidatus Paceibacterota bacterium]|jgi:ZIP family zinc transporter|nr:ZIP family metal transporter [Candidatus Paceibacterota bacterium]